LAGGHDCDRDEAVKSRGDGECLCRRGGDLSSTKREERR
jgi:hypothetical protein